MGILIERSGLKTREELDMIKMPGRTRSYTPVSHGTVIDTVAREARNMGLKVITDTEHKTKAPEFGTAKKGDQFFGAFYVEGQDHLGGEVQLMLGFRNSYDKSLSVSVCFGARVLVCSNLCFSGYAGEDGISGTITHKHTMNVLGKLNERLIAGLSQFEIYRNSQESFFDRLKCQEMDNDKALATIVRAARHDAIRTSDIINVANHWEYQGRTPETEVKPDNWHKDFQDRNAWSLFNCFTEIQKEDQRKNSYYHASNRSLRLTKFFQEEVN
jgi:hypothetical protein